MNILGIWDGHDSGAALLQDGGLRFAVNEERLTRRKLEVAFPARSIAACLDHAGLRPGDVALVAGTTSDPAKTLARLWPGSKERYYDVRRRKAEPGILAGATRAIKYRMTEWGPNALSATLSHRALGSQLHRLGFECPVALVDHHEAHAMTAAWASEFDACTVITIDGLGDGVSSTVSAFRNGRLQRVAATPARSSLGIFFEHVTSLLNMRELEDEGKVMALADYAAPVPDEQNPLLAWVRVRNGVIETEWPGHALRAPLARVHWRSANEQFAYMAQRALEGAMMQLARDAVRLTGLPKLALAGGVVSNVKATRQMRLLPDVEAVSVFPHMGDGGLALGAALASAVARGTALAAPPADFGLGESYSDGAIEAAIRTTGVPYVRVDDLPRTVATRLAAGEVLMWFQGGMEYGPRALGHRSVLARPDRADLRDRLNLVLKRRVWYQPFCPSMLASEAARLLEDWDGGVNPHMTMAYAVRREHRCLTAAVTSIDGTCRPQIVQDNAPGPFADLLRHARDLWQAGVVLNTSYNIHGEPLVCSPSDAIDVFIRSGADALAIGPFLVSRPA